MTPDTDPRCKPLPEDWRTPVADWAISLVSAGCSDATLKTRVDHLRRTARALGGSPWDVTAEQLVGWCGTRRWRRETRRSTYASLRRFFTWAQATGRIGRDRNPADALPQVRPEQPNPRPLPEPYLAIALIQADPRRRIILLLGAETGMRRGEIAQVNAADLLQDLAGWSLIVHGKGGRQREVPLSGDLAAEIRARCAHSPGGWLLPGQIDGHLSAQYVGKLASTLLPKGWALHTLRHRCATVVHDATGDLLIVQRMLGHASVATTQRYVKVRDDKLRAAMVHATTCPPVRSLRSAA